MERRRVSSGSPFEPRVGFSRALRVGQRVLVSGTAPVWPDGSCDPDPASQARRCFAIILAALAELGGRPADVVRTRTYLVDRNDWESIGRVHGEIFGEIRPASTMVVVAGLLDPRWRVEIEAEAILDDAADPPDDRAADRRPGTPQRADAKRDVRMPTLFASCPLMTTSCRMRRQALGQAVQGVGPRPSGSSPTSASRP